MQSAPDLSARPLLPARLPRGFVLDDYVIDGWLRDGGMAAIYRARREDDQRRVAVKLQLPNTAHLPSMCARFDMEADAMRRVDGRPNVVGLHHAGVLDDGRRYFVMEWIEGEDLEERLDFLRNQDERLSLIDIFRIGRDIATGLHAMHEQGLVHRDLKPANVMLGRDDQGQEIVKLVDFGIVADLQSTTTATHEADEAILGTSAYMAPEQAAGAAAAPGMDLFALGIVLYEALTGSCIPPDGWTPETLPSIESSRRGVPPELAELVRSCMSGEVRRRPRSAGEAALRLAGLVERSSEASPPASGSDAGPIRTGRTIVTPAIGLAELPPARTGETEVSLTQEEVDAIVGTIAPPAAAQPHEPGPPACVPVDEWLANEGRIAVIPDPAEAEDRGPRGSRMRVSPVAPSIEDVMVAAAQPSEAHGRPQVSPESESEPKPEQDPTQVETEIRHPSADGTESLSSTESTTASEAPVVFATRLPIDDYRAAPTIADEPGESTGSQEESGPQPPSTRPAEVQDDAIDVSSSELSEASTEQPLPLAGLPKSSASESTSAQRVDHFPVLPHVTTDDMLDVVPRRRHRWLIPTLVVPVLLVGAWLLVTDDGGAAQSPEDVTVVVSGEHEGTTATAPAPAPASIVSPSAKDGLASSKSEDPESQRGSLSSAVPQQAESDRRDTRTPSKAACKRKRNDAASARQRRDWRGVLRVTRKQECWPAGLRVERKRMRVEAHAESGDYQRCVREGRKNSDRRTATRVGWCKKKLSSQ